MNRSQQIQRLRAMADGWRDVRGRVSVSRADAALINDLIGQPGEPTAEVALIPAEEFVAAIDRIPADGGASVARPAAPPAAPPTDIAPPADDEPGEEPADDPGEAGDESKPAKKSKSTSKR